VQPFPPVRESNRSRAVSFGSVVRCLHFRPAVVGGEAASSPGIRHSRLPPRSWGQSIHPNPSPRRGIRNPPTVDCCPCFTGVVIDVSRASIHPSIRPAKIPPTLTFHDPLWQFGPQTSRLSVIYPTTNYGATYISNTFDSPARTHAPPRTPAPWLANCFSRRPQKPPPIDAHALLGANRLDVVPWKGGVGQCTWVLPAYLVSSRVARLDSARPCALCVWRQVVGIRGIAGVRNAYTPKYRP